MSARKNTDLKSKMYIYSLSDPRNNIVRYVGFTHGLKIRYNKHLSDARLNHQGHRNNWIRLLLSEDILPFMNIIEETNYEDREFREKYWIDYFKDNNLTNMTDGGEGMTGHSHSDVSKKINSRL